MPDTVALLKSVNNCEALFLPPLWPCGYFSQPGQFILSMLFHSQLLYIWWPRPGSLQQTVKKASVELSSVTQLYPTLCNPMNHSTPGLPVHHQPPEFTQTHAHWVGDAIQPSHPLLSPSPSAPNPSQHQGPFQWVNSSHEVAKVLEFQLQHQSFQWTPRTDVL